MSSGRPSGRGGGDGSAGGSGSGGGGSVGDSLGAGSGSGGGDGAGPDGADSEGAADSVAGSDGVVAGAEAGDRRPIPRSPRELELYQHACACQDSRCRPHGCGRYNSGCDGPGRLAPLPVRPRLSEGIAQVAQPSVSRAPSPDRPRACVHRGRAWSPGLKTRC